jgi:hypothetical protein
VKIKAICGDEPRREGEYPVAHVVNHTSFGFTVTAIVENVENLGDYGIRWYEVYAGSVLLTKMNAKYVASIEYFTAIGE